MTVIDEELKQQAKELWLQGKKYREISEITGIKESSIKSLASRYWKQEKLQPKNKKVATKVAVANKTNAPPKIELLPEEIETLANEDLTEKQRLFCLYYSKSFNAAMSYTKAYACDYQTALTNGPRLLGKACIRDEVNQLKKARITTNMLTQEDIIQKKMEIAFANISDYVTYGTKFDEETGKLKAYVNFVNSSDVDGSVIQEVKMGKDGICIKLKDGQKELDWLFKHCFISDEQKAHIELLNAQVKKLKADDASEEELEDDGFMEAIKGASIDGWSDEEI